MKMKPEPHVSDVSVRLWVRKRIKQQNQNSM